MYDWIVACAFALACLLAGVLVVVLFVMAGRAIAEPCPPQMAWHCRIDLDSCIGSASGLCRNYRRLD